MAIRQLLATFRGHLILMVVIICLSETLPHDTLLVYDPMIPS